MIALTYVTHDGTGMATETRGGTTLMQSDLLDFVWEPDPTRSRLACRITLTDALAGIVVEVLAKQG